MRLHPQHDCQRQLQRKLTQGSHAPSSQPLLVPSCLQDKHQAPNTTHKEAFSQQGPPWLSCLFSLSSSTPSAPAMQGFPSHDSTFAHTVPSARCPALFLHFYPGHPAHMSPPVRCFLSTLRESQGSSLSSHGSRILFPFPPLCLCHGRASLPFRSTRRELLGDGRRHVIPCHHPHSQHKARHATGARESLCNAE